MGYDDGTSTGSLRRIGIYVYINLSLSLYIYNYIKYITTSFQAFLCHRSCKHSAKNEHVAICCDGTCLIHRSKGPSNPRLKTYGGVSGWNRYEQRTWRTWTPGPQQCHVNKTCLGCRNAPAILIWSWLVRILFLFVIGEAESWGSIGLTVFFFLPRLKEKKCRFYMFPALNS